MLFQLTSINELSTLLKKRVAYYTRERLISLILSFIALILALGMVHYIYRDITRSLTVVTNIAKQISSGRMEEAKKSVDLAVKMGLCEQGEDDSENMNEIWHLSRAMVQMTINLDTIITQVRQSGIKVMGSSTQIIASVRQLEATVAEQAASTNEVKTTSSEISNTVNQLANTMCKVSVMASESTNLASEGLTSLKDIRETMQTLINSTQDISNKLRELSTKRQRI